MPSAMRTTRSPRHLRRAGTIAAAAALALSATVGLGIAPASAAPSTTHGDVSSISTGSAGDVTESKAGTHRITFTTHWIPVARGGQNVLSLGVVGPDRLVNGNVVPGFYRCVSFGNYQNNIDLVRSVSVDLPSPEYLTVGSFSGSDCNGFPYSKVGGTGGLDGRHASWTIFSHHAPAPR
jgi:hypothetical protein